MVQVTAASGKSGAVELGHGAKAAIQGYDVYADFHAEMPLEDGRLVKFFVRSGNVSSGVQPIVIVELCDEGETVGPEIFRRWLKQDDVVQCPS